MSVKDVYNNAERKGQCRVCGKEIKNRSRGRCSDCDYKNLDPIE